MALKRWLFELAPASEFQRLAFILPFFSNPLACGKATFLCLFLLWLQKKEEGKVSEKDMFFFSIFAD